MAEEEEVHKRIDLVCSMLKMEDGKVKVENRKQENERQGEEEPLVIPVNIQVCSPVLLPSNGLTTPGEHVPAHRFRWLLTPVLDDAFVSSGLGILKTIQRIRTTVHVHPKSSVLMGLVLIPSNSKAIAIDTVCHALKALRIESQQRSFLPSVPRRT